MRMGKSQEPTAQPEPLRTHGSQAKSGILHVAPGFGYERGDDRRSGHGPLSSVEGLFHADKTTDGAMLHVGAAGTCLTPPARPSDLVLCIKALSCRCLCALSHADWPVWSGPLANCRCLPPPLLIVNAYRWPLLVSTAQRRRLRAARMLPGPALAGHKDVCGREAHSDIRRSCTRPGGFPSGFDWSFLTNSRRRAAGGQPTNYCGALRSSGIV